MSYPFAFLATLLAPAVPVAQVPDTTVDVVSLAFAWPVGMRAHVDLDRVRVRSRAATADSTAMQIAYDLEVAPHPKGRLVRYGNFSTVGLTGLADGQQRLLQAAASIVPSYVVSDGGELVEIHQVAELRATLGEWLRETVSPLNGELEALVSQLLSEQTLVELASEQWNALVGTWVDGEFEVGAAYEMEADEPLPMLGNVLVPYRYELGASARVPCGPEDPESGCVELIMRSYPDPEALQPHLEAFVQKMMKAAGAGTDAPAFTYKELHLENEVVVVAEPRTLIPHLLTVTRAVDAVVLVAGVEQRGSDYQVARHVFTYR